MLRGIALLALALTGGCTGEVSALLIFPNEAARDGTIRIRVETYRPADQGCDGFLLRMAELRRPSTTPTRTRTHFFPFEEVELEEVPGGRQIILAEAFASEDDAPFLGACTDRYDSSGEAGEPKDVPLELMHIPYASLRMTRAGGNRQVGRPNGGLPLPLRVRVEATPAGAAIPFPGANLVFRTKPPFTVGDGALTVTRQTDVTGEAAVRVDLPGEPGTGSVFVTSPLIENMEVFFTVSVARPIVLEPRTFEVPFAARPLALRAGRVAGDGVDLVAISETELLVVADPLGVPRKLDVTGDVGHRPVAVEVADLLDGGDAEIAVLDARRSPDSEAAEVRIFTSEGVIELERRIVLTGSNAVGLAALRATDGTTSLAVATTGRSVHNQPCDRDQPGRCGCPPGESCSGDGVCVAADDTIEILQRVGDDLVEQNRCHAQHTVCLDGEERYECLDPEGEATQQDDHCGCPVRRAIRLGAFDAPLAATRISAGPLRAPTEWDLVLATAGGPRIVQQHAGTYEVTLPRSLAQEAVLAETFDLDTLLDGRPEVVWVEPFACLSGPNIDHTCPLARPVGATDLACLGIYQTESSGGVPDLMPPNKGACRRHPLANRPSAICSGQLDDDLLPDLALLVSSRRQVHVYAGDGYGGLLDPPDEVAVPGIGPMLCADLDGDGDHEIIIADEERPGRIHLLDQR